MNSFLTVTRTSGFFNIFHQSSVIMSSVVNMPYRELQTLSWSASIGVRGWEAERLAAESIMVVIRRLKFPLELDQLTRGLGNCMIIALLQQCQRPEISCHLPPGIKTLSSQTITTSTSTSFRIAVRDFVMASSEDQRVATLRENFQGLSGTSSWTDHWQKLVQDTVWGDAIFLRCAAYFLKIDILIIND